jgi:hypothetical protein
MAPALEECFVIEQGIPGGYAAGTQLRVRGYNGGHELPETCNFLRDNARRCQPPPNFAELRLVDVTAARAEAQAANQPPQQDRQLDSKALWKKCPFTKDADLFQLAVTQFAFPKPLELRHWFNRSGNVEFAWREAAVDRWIADMRARRDQLDRFLAGTR